MRVCKANGKKLSAAPSGIRWLTRSCLYIQTGSIHWEFCAKIKAIDFNWFCLNLHHLCLHLSIKSMSTALQCEPVCRSSASWPLQQVWPCSYQVRTPFSAGNLTTLPLTYVYKGKSTGYPFIQMGISVISSVPVKLPPYVLFQSVICLGYV